MIKRGVGIKKFEIELPRYKHYFVFEESKSFITELTGEDDHKIYQIPCSSNIKDDEFFTISSTDKILANLPHQRYYLNTILCSENYADTIDIGAIISIKKPNNIHLASAINRLEASYGSGTQSDPI